MKIKNSVLFVTDVYVLGAVCLYVGGCRGLQKSVCAGCVCVWRFLCARHGWSKKGGTGASDGSMTLIPPAVHVCRWLRHDDDAALCDG